MGPDLESARPDHNIAMWGAPSSGKTTLLAALNIALLQKSGDWSVIGADNPSIDFLQEKTTALSRDKEFPTATKGMERYRWLLIGKSEQQDRRLGRRQKPTRVLKIGINLLDPPGGAYGDKHHEFGTYQEELLDNLVQSRGIIFLFDPIREYETGDAFDHLYGALAQLAGKMLSTDEFTDGKLPHHLAVCITKFDEYRVLETAKEMRLLDTDPDDSHGFPRVGCDDAVELFRSLCGVSASGNAEMVLNALNQFFRRDRVKFFVTSSIGFYLDPAKNIFDPDDYQNLIQKAPESSGGQSASNSGYGKGFRIRGQVRPINVMEPMIWLGQRLSAEAPIRKTGP